MSEFNYFTNHCKACGGGIEFPANAVGEQIECPHCDEIITLTFPSEPASDPATQIETFLQASSFPTRQAELLLLSRFLLPTDQAKLPDARVWNPVLGDDPANVLARFVAEGLVQKAEPILTLQLKWSSELKALAKERGIPSSGTKETLAKRLVKADPEGMARLVADKDYLACSVKGRILAEKFIETEAELNRQTQEKMLQALSEGRFKDACLAVAAFEASRVFPRGVGMDWQRYDCGRDLSVLQWLFTAQLGRHARFSQDHMHGLRIAAAMIYLCGTNDPRPWLKEDLSQYQIDPVVEVSMVLSHAIHKVNLLGMRECGIKRVGILSSGEEDCPACQSHAGKTYPINAVPDVPFEGCTCEQGCRCIAIAKG